MKQSPVTKNEVQEIIKTEIKASEKRLSDKLDDVMGEVKNMREEFTLIQGKYDTVNDLENLSENHEKRLKKLEHPIL